jgi:hypothetical protein
LKPKRQEREVKNSSDQKLIECLDRAQALISRKKDFMLVAEMPDRGWREPSPEHPTGRWSLPLALLEAVDFDMPLYRQVRRVVIRHLPFPFRFMHIGPMFCPALWHVRHQTAIQSLQNAACSLREKDPS